MPTQPPRIPTFTAPLRDVTAPPVVGSMMVEGAAGSDPASVPTPSAPGVGSAPSARTLSAPDAATGHPDTRLITTYVHSD